MYELASCPFNPEHGVHGEVAVFENADGRLGFKCHHDGCSGKRWREFRKHFEPDAHSRKREARLTINTGATTNVEELRAAIVGILSTRLPATEKHEAVANVAVEFLNQRGLFYFHSQHRDFATAMFFDSQTKRLLRVQSDEFLSDVAQLTAINMGNPVFQYIAAAVEVAALHGTGIIPETYWASRDKAIYLSNGDGQSAKITASNVEAVDNGTDGVLFPVGMTLPTWELTEPQDPFESCRLFRDAAYADPHGKLLLKLWVTSLPTNPNCKPPIIFSGEIRSGKTKTAIGIARLFGLPSEPAELDKTDKSQHDFWVAINGGGLVIPDNVDNWIKWLPSALSAAATGGGKQERQLYTNDQQTKLLPKAWLAVTTANPLFASDSATADRLLLVRMNRRMGETDDAALLAEISAARSAGLSWVARTLSAALADELPTPKGLNLRHPDFGTLAIKLGRAMNAEVEAIAAMSAAEADKSRFCLENDPVGKALLDMMTNEPDGFAGTAAELLDKFAKYDADFGDDAKGNHGKRLWSSKRLGKRLTSLWLHIESLFDATREKNRNGIANFRIRSGSTAGFAGFAATISGKSSQEDYIGTFAKSLDESPQTPQPTAKAYAETLEI